ncbi:DUF3151 domain-containing protein [Euzebya sp.]|uniref:DUF3151 domain-containing protein n=1 Tax=Euzebya sp. TaxID=1971409 RepID=UPI0035116F35
MPELPLHGVPTTHLPPWPADAVEALDAAHRSDDPVAGLREVAAAHPEFLPAWADLADQALDAGDPVAGYAFARVGYHRGLDAIRRAGWRGQGPVPWAHEPNRGFLRALDALRRAALAIGEAGEPERCRDFLLQLDPDDPLGVADA